VHKFSLLFFILCLCSVSAYAADDIPAEVEVEQQDTSQVTPLRNQPENPRLTNEQPAAETKQQSSSGEPIFDWSKHQGETEVKHPFAEKGLIRITKDKVYYYKVNESTGTKAMQVQMGTLNPTNLKNPDAIAGTDGATFKENYSENASPTVLITREWDGWIGALGKVNYRLGTGVFVAQGHGHFVDPQTDINGNKLDPKENFTFAAFPESFGLVYRIQFSDRPLFVPYVEGGGTLWAFTEFRDDSKGPKFGGAASAYAAGGLAINMTYFDYMSRISLNREYGITGAFFTLEYRRIVGLSRYDFGGDYINGGFLMRY
jgi:hypothetical protein